MTISLEPQEFLEALEIFSAWLSRVSTSLVTFDEGYTMYSVPPRTKKRIDKECKLAFRILASANVISYREDRQAVIVPTRERAAEMLKGLKPLNF